jgi:hypothetical protein
VSAREQVLGVLVVRRVLKVLVPGVLQVLWVRRTLSEA